LNITEPIKYDVLIILGTTFGIWGRVQKHREQFLM